MIDFKIAFQADELLCGDFEKSDSDFRNHVKKISTTILNQTGITSFTKFKHSVLPRKPIGHIGFGFLI